ncbi:hypothetical protein GQ473_00065 [archaeon]|nr:hypothetical protein [archaeon]
MADLDFPSPASEGQKWVDPDDNLWQYNNASWGMLVTQVQNIDDLNDVTYTSPNVDNFLYYDQGLEKWSPDVLKIDDYFFKVKLSVDFPCSDIETIVPFDIVVEEFGTTGKYSVTNYEYTIPQTGIWQFGIYYHLDNSTSNMDDGYRRLSFIKINKTVIRYIGEYHNQQGDSAGSERSYNLCVGGNMTINLNKGNRISAWFETSETGGTGLDYIVHDDGQSYFWGSMVG